MNPLDEAPGEPPAGVPAGAVSRAIDSQKRQARLLLADIVRMRGLMPLLMKHRNGGSWTPREKAA